MWVYNLEDEDETHWEAMRREQESRGGAGAATGAAEDDVEGQGESFVPRNTDVSFASDRTSSFGMWTKRAASTSRRSTSSRSQSFTHARRFSHGNAVQKGGGVKGRRVDFNSPDMMGVGDHSSRWSSAA